MKRLSLLLPLILVACGTPQEQCIYRNTRDLRTVEKLIEEAEGNLKRGYALEERVTYDTVSYPCTEYARGEDGQAIAVSTTCTRSERDTMMVPKSIDLDQEAVKLAQLKKKQIDLSKAARSVIAQCKELHPE